MSGGPVPQLGRPKKLSNFTVSPSNSGESEFRICCRPPGMISLFLIGRPGRSTVRLSARTRTASTARSTALPYAITKTSLKPLLLSKLRIQARLATKHYGLRLILWLKGYTPFNFIKFLNHCAGLILLKKVGGGYIFIHRMLLDYFAELPTRAAPNKSASDRGNHG